MSLEHAILVSLAERAASGYDLARRFDASIGHFWPASHQQIYKVLGRMESAGHVCVEVVAQSNRPDKKVYAITDAGMEQLTAWLAEPSSPEHVRSEFTVKVRALHLVDRRVLLDDVRRRRSQHQTLLASYERSMTDFYPNPTHLADEQVGPYLALRGGILLERNGISWCDEILATLEAA